jgi:hypothetical protein
MWYVVRVTNIMETTCHFDISRSLIAVMLLMGAFENSESNESVD